jgi:hypothetical protein
MLVDRSEGLAEPVGLEFPLLRNWKLHETAAMRDSAHALQIRRWRPESGCKRERRMASQCGMAASRVVLGLELGQFVLQIWPIPEQDLVEKLATNRADQSLDELDATTGHVAPF